MSDNRPNRLPPYLHVEKIAWWLTLLSFQLAYRLAIALADVVVTLATLGVAALVRLVTFILRLRNNPHA